MEDNNVETRLASLEDQVRRILGVIHGGESEIPKVKDWRRSLGMFDENSSMKEIDKEGQQIREKDREQVANDHS